MFKNTLKTRTMLAGLAGSFILVGSMLGGPTGMVIGAVFGFAAFFADASALLYDGSDLAVR